MIEIIERRSQITPDWLSATLAESGVEATVVDVQVEPIIAGYFGCSSRLTPKYAEESAALPRSFFLKMATEYAEARERAAEGGMYAYEVGFYRELARKVNISTPRCYACEISQDGATFVLLLEDAAPLQQADQLEGLTLDQSMLAMQELAGLHASTWQGEGMERCDWAKIDLPMANGLAENMIQLESTFLENFGAKLAEPDIEILQRVVAKARAYWRYTVECKNQASVHCDFRADNMLFGERNGEPAMVTIDWVGTLSSSGRDLAHVLGTSLASELRAQHEHELLAHYHKTLVEQGVTDYSLQECVEDYLRNLVYPIFVVVSATASIDVDDRGQELFVSMFNRSCQAIRDLSALDLIEAL